MRIASLLASATEIVFALGLQDDLVAISHECDYPPEALSRPRVSRPCFDPTGLTSGEIDAAVRRAMAERGSVYELDEDRLRRLAPDLILTQEVCEVCAVPTSLAHRAARVLDGRARVLSLDAHTMDGILATIEQVGGAAGVPDRAAAVTADLRARLAAVQRAVAGGPRPRVLAIEWLDPPFVPGHWGPETIDLAGGTNLMGTAGERSIQTTWDRMIGLDPDVLVIMPCGYGLERTVAEAEAFADALWRIAPRALQAGRAYAVDGSAYFNRSGPRAVDGVEILAALLHPECSSNVPLEGRAAALSLTQTIVP